MSARTFIIFLFILMLSKMAEAQDYSRGFELLETGKFEDAREFFKKQLDQGYDDMTVRLCYGRAIGLSGEPEEANQNFKELLSEYPGNFELELNLAESLMWMKDYNEAKDMYAGLVTRDSSSLAASLGYANSLSSTRAYEDALTFINKALAIQPGNENAIISKKYILLGLAETYKLDNQYFQSKELLESLYGEFPGDLDVGLPLAYLYMDLKLYDNALTILENIVARDAEGEAKVLQALSSIELIKFNRTRSLALIDQAISVICGNSDNCTVPAYFNIHKGNILIALKQYDMARELIDSLASGGMNEREVIDLKVNLLLGQEKYKDIDNILDLVSDREHFHEIKSKVAIQRRDLSGTKKHLDSIHQIASESVFHHYMSKELNKSIYHEINPIYSTLSDNGGNEVTEYGIKYTSSPMRNLKITGFWKNRVTNQDNFLTANHRNVGAGIQYFIIPGLHFEGHLGSSKAVTESNSTSRYSYHSGLSWNHSKHLNLNFTYTRSYQDYNVGLISSNLAEDRYAIKYNNNALPGLGIYAEVSKSYLNDGNESNFYYVSLFRNFTTLPLLQVGVNAMYLAYANKSDIYFTPSSYNSGEIFVKYDNKFHPQKKVIFSISGAIGMQKIESNMRQNTNRLELEAGYKFHNQSYLTAFLRYNNSSSASAAGYSFTSLGIAGHFRI